MADDFVCPDGPSCPDPACREVRHASGLPVEVPPTETLFAAVVRLKIPYQNHESDLYLPATGAVATLLRQHGIKPYGPGARAFRNQVDDGQWFDIPFRYLPWWEARAAK